MSSLIDVVDIVDVKDEIGRVPGVYVHREKSSLEDWTASVNSALSLRYEWTYRS